MFRQCAEAPSNCRNTANALQIFLPTSVACILFFWLVFYNVHASELPVYLMSQILIQCLQLLLLYILCVSIIITDITLTRHAVCTNTSTAVINGMNTKLWASKGESSRCPPCTPPLSVSCKLSFICCHKRNFIIYNPTPPPSPPAPPPSPPLLQTLFSPILTAVRYRSILQSRRWFGP